MTEALARQLSLNPRGLLVSRDEGSAWVGSIGQYKNGLGTDRQFFLSALFGKEIRVDRRGNPDSVPLRVPDPFLSVVGNLPPDMLGALREVRGRSDGFLERILFAFPDPRPKPRWSDTGIPGDVQAGWERIVRRLRGLSMMIDADGRLQPRIVEFTPDAKAAWVDAYNTHVDGMNADPAFASRLAAEGKLADFAGRLILILHMLQLAAGTEPLGRGPIPPVTWDTVEKAVRLWRYFRSHQRRVRASMNGWGDADMPEGARLVLKWIENHPGGDQVSQSDLTRAYPPSRGYDRAMIEDGSKWLESRHAIRRMPSPQRPQGKSGRKPAPRWEIHPELLDHRDKQGFQGEARSPEQFGGSPESPDTPALHELEAVGDQEPVVSSAA